SPQPRRGHRVADDVAKDIFERALNLAVAGERVARFMSAGKTDAVDLEAMLPVREKLVIEAPAARDRDSGVGAEERLAALPGRTLIEQVQRGIFVQLQIVLARGCSVP